MGAHRMSDLPPAPSSVATASGFPRFGTYQGALPAVDYSQLAAPYGLGRAERTLRRKRWQYVFVSTPEIAANLAIVDLGYTSSAFVVVTDLKAKRTLADESFLGLPGQARVNDCPGEGLEASFKSPGVRLSVRREAGSDRYDLEVELSVLRAPKTGGMSWRGSLLAHQSPPLTVIAPVEGQRVHTTQKAAGLLAVGELRVGKHKHRLDGGVAGLDYSNGYPARHTSWRWAMAAGRLPDGTLMGLNLVEGFNEDGEDVNENAVWVGQTLYPLPRAKFRVPSDPLDLWEVETVGGQLALRFRPQHVHREERDYKWVKSRLWQPVGMFEGTLNLSGQSIPLSQLPGVTEDQDVLW
jgi:hypothetical protein